MSDDGLIPMKPTSISHSGTSATINSNGGVDFNGVTSISLNGVFTSAYDNYLIVVEHIGGASEDCNLRLRSSGTDATGSNYVYQILLGNGSTVQGSRSSTTTFWRAVNTSTVANGSNIFLYGPALTQPTSYRETSGRGVSSAFIDDNAGTHSLSTSYDGFTVYTGGTTLEGTIHTFGWKQ